MYDDERREYRRQKKEAKHAKLMRDTAVEALLQHQHGRVYLRWLLEVGKAIGFNPFTGKAPGTDFGCGEMNVGQQIMQHIIEVSPAGFIKLLEENGDDGRNDDDGDDDGTGESGEPA